MNLYTHALCAFHISFTTHIAIWQKDSSNYIVDSKITLYGLRNGLHKVRHGYTCFFDGVNNKHVTAEHGQDITLLPGQILASTRFQSDRRKWYRRWVMKFLERLVSDEMITLHKAVNTATIIEVINYAKYQEFRPSIAPKQIKVKSYE